jgi:hypothetical protein
LPTQYFVTLMITVIRNVNSGLADADATAMTARADAMSAEAVYMTRRAHTLQADAAETIKAALSAKDVACKAMIFKSSEIERMLNNALYVAETMKNTARQMTIEAIRLTQLASGQVTDAARIIEHRVTTNAFVMFG